MNKREKTQRAIFAFLRDHPGSRSPSIAQSLGLNRVTVYLHLKDWREKWLILSEGKKTNTRYFLTHFISYKQEKRKDEVLLYIRDRVYSEHGEVISLSDVNQLFQNYSLYIDTEDHIYVGIDAFLLWCMDKRHDFSSRIREKAYEYFTLLGSIEYRRNKHGFFDATESARSNLQDDMNIGFDYFLFHDVFSLPDGYGRTRVALELLYGKQNSDEVLLTRGILGSIVPIQDYIKIKRIDAIVFTPPTQGRNIQFRNVLERMLSLPIQKISAEKIHDPNRILQAQKNIRDRKLRIKNALWSISIEVPTNLLSLQHILILDDSFTTGATPNAIAIQLRNAGFKGGITIITICGSFSYSSALSDDEI